MPNFVGNSLDNLLDGSDSGDKIWGKGGIDFIYGNGGNDTIYGDRLPPENVELPIPGEVLISGNDVIRGGNGNDIIFGEGGNDQLFGEFGNDYLGGGDGDDSLLGGSGDDKLVGGDGADGLDGGADQDFLFAGDGNDQLFGESGADTLFGGGGNDYLAGGSGNDSLAGTDSTTLFGLGEQDTLVGGTGSDSYILGDFDRAYYDNGNPLTNGASDYARIIGFSKTWDTIKLHGLAWDYELKTLGAGNLLDQGRPGGDVGIYLKNDTIGGKSELIAVVQDVRSLNFLGGYFTFMVTA